MKLAIFAAALFALVMLSVSLALPSRISSDPCDTYGNCISSSITYTRSNPDLTLYQGDSFTVSPSVSLGPNTTSYSLAWSYDNTVLVPLGGGGFRLIKNVTGTSTVTVTATFTMVETIGNSTVTLYSSLSTSQSVTTRAFILDFHTQLSNATDSNHLVLRNPDGSFYHQDEFFINYTYTFLFMKQRPDIKVVVEPTFDSSFVRLIAFQNSSSSGYFQFTVANHTGTSSISMTAHAFNFYDELLGFKVQKQPFAVVNYAPYFTYFTYMQYNSRNSSAYERPFVTLIRYGGNNPSYSYGGDINTGPIIAPNDTRERALINSFNFTTVAWGMKANLSAGDISKDLSFWNQTSVSLGTRTTNQSYPIITFAHRVVKFYFTSGTSDIQSYTVRGLEYFNVTELAVSKHFAGGDYGLFNTSYVYEPVYYSGYLTFFTYGPTGLDPSSSVNVTLISPDLLNPHLLASVNKTFGNSPAVVRDFKKDLFPAYSSVMNLTPASSGGGKWIFLLNDTNLAMLNDTRMPYLYITVQGRAGSYSYSIPDAFSSFVINRTLIPSLSFSTVNGFYLDEPRQLLALRLNYSFTSASPFVAWDYGSGTIPSFVSPISYEPGNLSKVYGFLYGGNSTIYANLDGGGGSLLGIKSTRTTFRAMVMIGPQTGGGRSIWVKDPTGNVIMNDTLTANTEPPSPSGFFGFYALSFPMSVNGTYQFGITNSWGISSVFQTYSNIVHIPPPPSEEHFLMTFFGFLVVGLYFLGKIAKRIKAR